MQRLPLITGVLRMACQRSSTAITPKPSANLGYVPPIALASPTANHIHRFYSQTNSTSSAASTLSASSASDTVKIYSGNLTGKFWRLKLFSMSTSVVGLCAQPVLVEKGAQLAGTAGVIALCSIGGFFCFITPVLLHFVVKKYVIEMEHNPTTDEYTATTISLFMRKQKTTFKVSDIFIPEIPGMFTSFKVGKGRRPLFVDAPDFNDTHHYARFMGYDKPINIKFESDYDDAKVAVKNAATKSDDVK